MQSFRIAYRNVLRQFKRTALLGGAIAFGFFIFTVLNGFTGGLLDSVSANFAETSGGHIYVSGSEVSELGSEIKVIRDGAVITDALSVIDDDLESYNVRSSARVSVIFGSKEETVTLEGIDFSQETQFISSLTFAEGSSAQNAANALSATPNGILLPEEILADLNIQVGETVILKTSTLTGQQNVTDAIVAGSLTPPNLLAPGAPVFGYTHLAALNTLLGAGAGEFQTLNIYLDDLDAVDGATDTLQAELERTALIEPREESGFALPDPTELFGGISSVDEAERWEGTKLEVSNLNDQLAGVSALVGAVNAIGLVIFIVILTIIMVGIMNSYRMVMIERTAEIGTMRAMGVHQAGIRNIFVWEALLVALGGTLAGLVLALLVMSGLGLLDFGREGAFSLFLTDGRLNFDTSLPSTLANILLVCAMSAAAVFIPARAAARLQPAEALRA